MIHFLDLKYGETIEAKIKSKVLIIRRFLVGGDQGWMALAEDLSWLSRVEGNLNEEENLV